MSQLLPHERLHVYERATTFVRSIAPLVDEWPQVYSVRDQLDRASESLVTNLARAAWHSRTSRGIYILECSLGSALECAACMDIAFVYGFLAGELQDMCKSRLLEIASMQVGLRRSWMPAVREADDNSAQDGRRFPHESLQVYISSLELLRLLAPGLLTPGGRIGRNARRIDESLTSLLLNVAEGNGRFSQLDHRLEIELAERGQRRQGWRGRLGIGGGG